MEVVYIITNFIKKYNYLYKYLYNQIPRARFDPIIEAKVATSAPCARNERIMSGSIAMSKFCKEKNEGGTSSQKERGWIGKLHKKHQMCIYG